MNITRYKNIDELIEKKDVYLGQEITNDQLKLISKGYIPTKFNVGINDVLEFTLYDSSNNLLPQESYGNVRYIKGDNIKNYLLVSNNPSDLVSEGGGFMIDVKKLVKEAGYNTGYFRVQINFVNNRVGSDYSIDKMWIQEISPTRFEMRLLPFNNFDENNSVQQDIKKDLNQSYDSFLLGKFSGDEVYQEIYSILDSITASDIANMMKTIMTQPTINKLAQEFNIIGGYDLFYARVLDDMKKAVVNELLYKNSTIGSNDFGKPISEIVRNKISQKDYNYYTKSEIIDLLNLKFKESVTYHLPKRSLNEKIILNEKTQQSLDKLNDIVQTLTSNTIYQIPNIERTVLTPPINNIPSPSEKIYQTEIQTGIKDEVIVSDKTPPILLTPTTPTPTLDPIVFTTGPTVSNITINSAAITFSTNIGAPAKIIFSSPCPASGCEFNLIRGASTHYYNIVGLNPNTTYSFIVVSTLSDGRSITSNSISFDTLASLINENIDKFDPYLSKNTTTTPNTPPADYSGGGSSGVIDSSVLITNNTSISGGTLTTGATRNRRTQ